MQYPSRLFGIAPTKVPGEYGSRDVAYSRTSFDKWEHGNEFVGTAAALWGITAGVYLALMGPHGMRDLAHAIVCRNAYAKQRLAGVPGVRIPHASQFHFKEFVVNFDAWGSPSTPSTGPCWSAEPMAVTTSAGTFPSWAKVPCTASLKFTPSRMSTSCARRWPRCSPNDRFHPGHFRPPVYQRLRQPAALPPRALGRARHLRAVASRRAGRAGSGTGAISICTRPLPRLMRVAAPLSAPCASRRN